MRSVVRSALAFALLGWTALVAPMYAVAATSAVTIKDFAFSPPSLQIATGDVVTWTNRDAVPHSIHWTNGGLADSPILLPGGSHAQTFGSPGTYAYVCGIHGASMSGSITVVQTQTPTRTPAPPPATAPPSPTPSASPSPTPSVTASATPTPTPSRAAPSATPSATPSASALAAPASQANTSIGIALVLVGVAILAGALWWRFGGAR